MEELEDRDLSPPPPAQRLSSQGGGGELFFCWNSGMPWEDGFWVLVQPTDCLCEAL